MRNKILGGMTSLLLPFAAYGAPLSYGYQRKAHTALSSSMLHGRLPMSLSAKPSKQVDADVLAVEQGVVVRELVVMDAGIAEADKAVLRRALKPGVELVEISSAEAGLPQLIKALSGYKNLAAVHVVSHAEAGAILLGNSRITQETFQQEVQAFAALKGAVREGGDLLFYGCNLAADEAGEALLDIVQRNTHLDVAASNDLTGHAALAGDWDLEIQRGQIDSMLAFSEKALMDFSGILAPTEITALQIYAAALPNYGNQNSLSTADGRIIFSSIGDTISAYDDGSTYGQITPYSGTGFPIQIAADGTIAATFELHELKICSWNSSDSFSDITVNLTVTGYNAANASIGSNNFSVTTKSCHNPTGGNFNQFNAINLSGVFGTNFDLRRVVISYSTPPVGNEIFILKTVTLDDIKGPNTAPTATNLTQTVNYTEDPGGSVALTDIVVTDADVGDTVTATLTFNNTGAGTLTTGTFGSATSTYNAGTGVWTVNGSVADVNAALAAVAFTPSANWDQNVTVTTRIRDAAGTGPVDGTVSLNVTAVNDAPTATNLTQTKSAIEGGPAVALDDIVITNPDTGDTVTATLTFSDSSVGTLSTGTFGSATSSYDGGMGVWTVTGSVSDVNAALAAVAFTPSAGNDQNFTITTRVRDAASTGPADGTISVTVTPVFDPPTDIALSNASILQSATSVGADVGTLSTTDPDSSSFTYSLVSSGTAVSGSCTSDSGNASFQINGSTLETAAALAAGSYNVCIQTSDGTTGFKEGFVVTVSDDVAPAVSSVSVPANDTYVTGETLSFTVNTSENITVTGAPTLPLTIGAIARQASVASGSGSTALVFSYTVQPGDSDPDGIQLDAALSLNGGTLRDAAGNDLTLTLNAVASTAGVLVDAAAPSGHSVSFDDSTINDAEAGSISFTFASAEVGATYTYSISSSGGGTPVTDTGTIASAAEQISGIDVSGLSDGTLTLSVNLTDTAGNAASAVTDTATLDSGAPSGHSVSFDDSAISAVEATAISFTFASAEVGSDYSYTISSSGGGTPVSGSGTVASAAQQISSINVSGLSDGTLTLSVTLTDAAGNGASAVTDTATLDSSVPSGHSVSFDDDTINGTEATAASFTFASAEVGSGYSYTISSSGGGTPVTGSGTLASATQQISGINVSGLSDGTLTLSVTLTDSSGNAATAVTDTAVLDATAPSGHSVSFDDDAINSAEASSVSFTFANAQVSADYSYSISSSGGGTPVTGTGTIASAAEQISGINVSGLSDGTLTLSVNLTDSEGNAASAVTDTAALDRAGPTASIVVADSELMFGETTSVTVTFDEAVSGFANDDLTIESGTLATVTTSDGGITWTATLTPSVDTYEPTNVITLNNAGVTDAAGNAGSGTTASNNYIVRTQSLTLLVTSALDTGDDATFAATVEDDEADGNGLSIREALNWARAGDTITFDLDSGTGGNQGGAITLNGSQLGINYSNLKINGDLDDDGAADVTISANNASRVLFVNTSLTGIEITGLTLTEGTASGGGGLYLSNGVNVTVRDSNITDSSDSGVGGGGIYGSAATLTMINSTVSGNTSSSFGGGIRIVSTSGTLNLLNSTVIGNTTTGAGAHGGGIQYGATGGLTVINSTISGNAATGAASFGGGLRITSGTAFVYNSTIVGNASTDAGGGVHANGNDTFVNTVVAGNTSGAGATAGASGSPLATGGSADDVGGTIEIATNSYFGSNVAITTDNNSLNNQGTSNLLLGDLTYSNGADVQTHRPQNGSALLEAGSNADLPADTFDLDGDSNTAEGLPIDANGSLRVSNIVDIGAVEANAVPALSNVNGGNTFVENSSAIVIDNDILVSDVDLDLLNSGNGDYSGASVVIARNGGAVVTDNFGFNDGSGMSLSGSDLVKNGQIIASFDASTPGQLTITFTNANGEIPENTDVSATLQQITYSSTSDDPGAGANLDITLNDGAGGSVTEMASVIITQVNDAPTLTATAANPTFTEGGSAATLFSATAVDTVEAGQLITALRITFASVANGDDEILGIDGSNVAMTNGNALTTATNSMSVSVSVTGSVATIDISHATGISVASAQALINGITYSNSNDNPATAARTVTVTGISDNGGVTNGGVDASTLSVATSVTVAGVNDAPTISGTPLISVNQGALYSFTPTASDLDSGLLTFSISNAPVWASFDTSTGILSGTPAQAHVGTTTGIVITVSDGVLSASLPAFNLTVVNVNDAPVISGTPATTVDQDVAYSFVPTASDLDSDPLTFSATNLPAWASLNAATGAITGTPDIDDVGEYANIVLTVSDGTLTANLPAFTITVQNNAPVISGTPQLTAYVAAPYSFTPTASDVDSDSLTFTATGLPAWLFLNTATGQISGTPGVSEAGMSYDITITVSDSIDTTTLPVFSLSVEYDGDEPVVTPPDEVTLNADGLLTPISLSQLLGLPPDTSADAVQDALRNLASDRTHGGACCITEPFGLQGDQIMLAPGRHEVIWRATNQANLTGEAVQVVNVLPLISLNKDQVRGEGSTAMLRVLLNGRSPVYPLTVGFTVDGTATGADHDLAVTSVTFAQDEIEQQVVINLTDDGIPEGNETLIISLDESGTDVGLANFGNKRVHEIQIVEENVAPLLRLNVQQNSEDRRIITQDGGVVQISAVVDDPNPADTHLFDWQYPNGFVVTPVTDASGTFDPAALEPGIYEIVLTVTEDSMAPLMTRESVRFQIIESAPALGTEDSDDDGIDDATEGLADSDGDGQPDYVDNIDLLNVLNETRDDDGRFLVEGDPGLRLQLGEWSLLDDADGAQVSRETLAAGGVPADSVPNVGGYFDFVVRDIPAHGSSVRIVLPQRVSIPALPVYRKFAQGVWFDFVENARNQVASAAGSEGVCPPPGSDEYSAGLNTGHWCVQLTIEDGGPNDADGEANGTVVDPGGVAGKSSPQNVVEYKTRGGGGGSGGSISVLMLGVFLLLVLIRLQRARKPAVGLAALLLAISTNGNAQSEDATKWWDALYLQGGVAYAHSNLSRSDAESRLGGADDGVHVTDIDDKRMAWNLGLGYSFSEQWALEISYLDLGEVEMTFDAPISAEQLAQIHPESGKGVAVSGIYLHPLQQHLWLQARLGLFSWDQDYETVRGVDQVDRFSDSGTDLLWGLGVACQLGDNTTVTGEIQGVDFDNDPTLSVGVGLRLRFH